MEYTITPLNPHRRRSGDGAIGMLLPERSESGMLRLIHREEASGCCGCIPPVITKSAPVQIGVQQLFRIAIDQTALPGGREQRGDGYEAERWGRKARSEDLASRGEIPKRIGR